MKRTSSLLVLSLAVLLVVALVPAAVMAAGGAFVDDDDSIFEADIEWLAAAGVTKGCNPPVNDLFCPNDSVSRGQMAAFMRRFAQYLGGEDGQVALADHADHATQAENAQTVGDLMPGDLIRINGAMIDADVNDFTAATWTNLVTTQIEAPVAGVLLVMGSVGLEDDSSLAGDSWIMLRLTVDGVSTHSDDWAYTVELSDDPNDEPFATVASLNAAVAVGQGQHTIAVQALEVGGGTYITGRSVSAVFSAFGGGIPVIPVSVEPEASHNN